MKKKFIALAIVSIATLAGARRANAQIASNSHSLEYQKSIGETPDPAISPRALKNFASTYKNVKDEKWMKTKDGFAAGFTADDVKATILYDKKGNWTGSIKNYGEEKMLREVRHTVKSAYYDYKIVYTQEVETTDSQGTPTYIICLEDKANIKIVRIRDGEMNVWKEFTKAN